MSVRGPSQDFESSLCRVFRNYHANHGYGLPAKKSQLIDECYPNAQRIQLRYFFHHFFAQKNGVLQRRRSENFVHYNYTVRCSLVKDTVNPDQVILQLAAVVFNVLFSPKMREEPVEKEEPGFFAGDGTTYGCQIMQLCEGAGKGRFTTLVRTGYNNYALCVSQVEIIADNGRAFTRKLMSQS